MKFYNKKIKIFSTIILSLCSVLGFSQTILYQAESTSRTVQDPQSVVLAQGFRASSSSSNPFVAKIGPATENPGGGPADSNAGANNPNGTTVVDSIKFHDTKGNIEVNQAGQLQFTLPIALPPGVKNVAPQVNLMYTSGSGNGIAGYGWNISGITAISRIGKNIEQDGDSKGIQLDYSDYYSFNGQRLILKYGEYGKDGAEYVTEKYSNIKIKSVGQNPEQNGPLYFEVTFEDGSQALYGLNADSRTSIEYNITTWKDAQGNYISYNYIQGNGVATIYNITWGGNENLNKPHFNSIEFNYINRSLREQSYVNGISLIQNNLLKEIKVASNGSQFKKYAIEYVTKNTNYLFVNKITEYNSKNEAANPIIFENEIDPTGVNSNLFRQDSRFDNIRGENVLSGDFNGDGKLDFLNGKNLMLGRLDGTGNFVNVAYNGTALSIGTYADANTPFSDQVLITGAINRNLKKSTIYFYKYSNNAFVNIATKEIDLSAYPQLFEAVDLNEMRCHFDGSINKIDAKEVDFNGDGISELILIVKNEHMWTCQDYNSSYTWQETTGVDMNFYVDFKNNIFSPIDDTNFYVDYKNTINIDLDGDGKTELLHRLPGVLTFLTFNVQNSKFEKIYPDIQAGNSGYNGSLPPIIGDYNGDGKTDILVPVAEDSSDWNMYISSGKGFVNHYYSNLYLYKPAHTGSGRKFRNTLRSYWAPDLNKDGKSDFVVFESQKWFRDCIGCVNNPDSSYGFNYFRNTGVDSAGKPIFTFNYNINPKEATSAGNIEDEDINYSMYGEHYIPMFGSFRLSKLNTEFIILHKTKLITWNLDTKTDVISRIKSISQSGIKTQIDYSNLVNGNVYKSYYNTSPVFYPYANIIQNFNYYVVSTITQGERRQEFRYRDLIGSLNGRGIIGFRQTARSTFFTDLFVNTKIWTGSEINPINEGLPYKDWSIRTADENKIFPNDISQNNYQLLSFKQYDYKIDKLLNGSVVTNTVDPVNKPKIVTAINPSITVSKDFLNDIKTVNKVEEYDNLYLPKKSIKTINDGYAILTTQLEYYPPNTTPGNNYSIGRPKSKTDINQAYGDTKSSKEEYTYENNLLKTLKVWNRDNTEYILDSYNYDSFGNITEKTVSNSVDSQTQTTSNQYDEKGRFVTKKIDNLGLQNNIIYNDWGLITKQTDPLGNILVNEYDGWGKVLKSKNNLGGTTTYEYKKDKLYNSTIIQYDPDGNISKKYTNKWGQEYRTSTKAFEQGQYISIDTQYDILGRKKAESEPYGEGLTPWQWNVIEYNDSFYPAKVKTTALATLNNGGEISSFLGKQTETFVSGTITTSTELNGYNRITYKTTDALGNTTSTTDTGGSIVFSYNAAGEQIKAQYAENIVKTQYDTWGRKSEFNDPSNGIYKYEYDGFGQPKKVTSPKGTKEYVYNNLGQLISQKEISTVDGGQATNKIISFVYDDKGRLVSKSGTSNGKTYSSNITYDPQGRILSSSENSNERYFIQKGITYDDKLRVTSYEKQLFSAGVLTKVQIENIYSIWNGDLYQIKDKNSGKVLWELKNLDARGNVLKAQLGAAEINQTFEHDGTLSQVNHGSTAKQHILRLSYTFNPIKNELEARATYGDFYIPESFDYDGNNRLTNWTNPVTGIKTQNVVRNIYDDKGRILENDQIGKIKFDNSAKIYQPTGMVLNAAGEQNYTNDLIQSINYNENNDPVFIDGMKGDVAFQYGLAQMRQRVTYGGNFDADGNGKFTKFYSEDGSFEVTKDNITGKEKHILYIGGSPYESNIIYVKNYNEISASYKFLHKDYLGSILAVSDEAGNKLEQRHFDAWGNLTHIQIGNGQIITDVNKIQEIVSTGGLLLERGYTSHEHFMEVGIIHMNGRLYDPLLRRFLNADENIQDAYNTQSYNKYGYVMNNPLMFNDPNGEIALPAAMLVAFAAAIVTSITGDYIQNRPVNIGSLYQSVTLAAMTSYLTFGVGELFRAGGQIANSLSQTSLIIARAGAHAITQGTLSYMQGGNFWSGALSGAFASASNDLLDLAVKNVGENNILRSDGFALFNGAVSGGVGSVLGGGNFWMGAGQGLMVTAFNFLAHKETTIVEETSTDGDCPTCPKNAKQWQNYTTNNYNAFDKEFWTWEKSPIINGSKTYFYSYGKWHEIKLITGDVPISLGSSGGLSFLKYSSKALKSLISTEKGAQSAAKVSSIAKAMKNGDFSIFAEPIHTYMYKGKSYILDGHNRIKAAIKANQSLEIIELNTQKAIKLYKNKIEEIHKGLH